MGTHGVNEYKKIWMRDYRKRKKAERLKGRGKCPVCEMLLIPENEPFHQNCPYFKEKSIHAFLAKNKI